MKEIKFRAWDKTKKVMSIIRSWDFAHGDIELGKELRPEAEKFEEELELMQFTGLKDKNGKDIYEGDIVKSYKEYNSYTGLNSRLYGGNVYEIKNNGWRFYLEPESLYQVDLSELEVIGNIYENKDLLK
jgi:uncharacterized phage protein (TIGR01671 family)